MPAIAVGDFRLYQAHVLGVSFGGFVVQEFAINHPQMTRSLILCQRNAPAPINTKDRRAQVARLPAFAPASTLPVAFRTRRFSVRSICRDDS